VKLLITADAVGGVWQYATDLARSLVPQGVEPILVLLGPPPSEAQRASVRDLTLIETGLPLDWLAQNPDEVRTAAQVLARLAADLQVDLVQLNAPALGLATYPAPVIAVTHSCLATWWEAVIDSDMPHDFQWRNDLHATGLAAADQVVAPSAAFAEATRRVYGLASRPTVVHNGRAPLPLPSVARERSAFTAGRLWDKGKDAATLDQAAALLPFPVEAAGALAGPNGDSIAFAHVRSVGSLSEAELASRLAARPVYVSAALYEPFGLAVLEAAQAGCPLVLSDIPSFRELWDGAALFVAPRDSVAFAAAIARAADQADELGATARERAARYTPDAMASGMAALYYAQLGRSAGQARAAA
jgi:glycosyltransferase involved in cell wall biosynthesis